MSGSIPECRLRWRDDRQQWYIFWTEGGKTKRVSTGTDDEAAARRALAEFVSGWLTPAEPEKVTVKEVIDHYLADKKRDFENAGRAVSNYDSLRYALKPIEAYFGHQFATGITRQHTRQYISMKQGEGLSNGTIRKTLDILVAALNHARKDGWLQAIPHIDKPAPPAARDKWATAEQARQFIDSITTPHVKLFAMLAMHTLSRKTAILELTWQQVDMENGLIHYNPEGRVQTKKRRVPVPINKTLKAALLEAVNYATCDYVVEYGGKKVGNIRKAFERAAAKAEMEWMTPHVLRHTGATLLAQKGIPMWQIAGMMGDSLETTERHYAKHHPDYLKDASSALDSLLSDDVPTGTNEA